MSNVRNRINTQIYEQASVWFVEFRSGELDAEARRTFVGWLRTSPEHMRAYLELAAIWNEGPGLDLERQFEGLDLGEVAGENVVRFDRSERFPEPSIAGRLEERLEMSPNAGELGATIGMSPNAGRRGAGRRVWYRASRWRAYAASLVIACVLGTASYLYSQRNTYSTGIGEQRTLTLRDGSTIQLNARSEVHVEYGNAERGITLRHGQALFKVAHDTGRPFIVTADQARVRAVGTQFDVYRRPTGTTVTVIEGRVAVATPGLGSPVAESGGAADAGSETADAAASQLAWPMPGGATPGLTPRKGEILLAAGEQATVTAHDTERAATPNVKAATAWTQNRLIFESTSLQEVATEFNRYNARRLVIQGNQLARLRITGTFSSTDPGSIIRFLRARPGVTVSEEADQILVTAENSSAR